MSEMEGYGLAVTSPSPKPYRAMIFWGWVLSTVLILYGILGFAAEYVSPAEMRSSLENCPPIGKSVYCPSYEEAMSYMWGQVTGVIIGCFILLIPSLTILMVGIRRKGKAS